MLVATFFRFYRLTELPPGFHGDEAMDALKASEVLRTGDVSAFYKIRSLAEIFPGEGEEAGPPDALSEEFIGSAHERFMRETFGSEGLFATITAVAMSLLGKDPWAIRPVAAFFGTLTVLGLFLLAREIFRLFDNAATHDRRADATALVSAYLLAVSFWHVNFSRIGFRSILMPLFTAFAMYFLVKALWRSGRLRDYATAGALFGLGFHTYIAYRVMPIVVVSAFALKFIETGREERNKPLRGFVVLVLFAIALAFPLMYYYLQNPGDFLYRMATMSTGREDGQAGGGVFHALLKTLGQFNVAGDANLRHNIGGAPHLIWPIGVFFLIGIGASIRGAIGFIRKAAPRPTPCHALLLIWFFASLAPSFLSAGPHPHAIRSFGAIVPAVIFAAHGAWLVYSLALARLGSKKRAGAVAGILVLAAIGAVEYKRYFIDWPENPELGLVFHEPHVKTAGLINSLPREYKKFVVVNFRPETVMYLTDSYDDRARKEKNIVYLMPKRRVDIDFENERPYVVVPLDYDAALMEQLRAKVPGRFVRDGELEHIVAE
jgi:hypothetical protein